MTETNSLVTRLECVRNKIIDLEVKYGRTPGSVSLLAVSKIQSTAKMFALISAGQRAFGENYLQEALEKIAQLQESKLEWHFIGPVQSNKTNKIACHFDWLHSLERIKIAERLSAQRPDNLLPLNLCLQVNISNEASKQGVLDKDVFDLAARVAKLPRLKLRGLMGLPAPTSDFSQQRASFRQLYVLYTRLRDAGHPLDTLSMGTSHDMEAAIAEGATIVRIGTALFGQR